MFTANTDHPHMQLHDSLRDIQPQSQTIGIVMLLQFERAKDMRQIVRLDAPSQIGDRS